MPEGNWVYRFIVILSLCILLVWTYLTNEETFLNYISGKFILDTRLVWQIGIFALLSIVLFYLMQSTLDYKGQNKALKEYLKRLQRELDSERGAIQGAKSEFNDELMRLESFIIVLSDMAKQISSVLETEQLLRLILRKTADLLGSEKCALFRVDNKQDKLLYIDSFGYAKKELEDLNLKTDEESGQIGLAAGTGMFVSQSLLSKDPARKHVLNNDKIQTKYCQPIVHYGASLAVICVGDISKNLTFQQVVRILSTLANFASIALTNTRLVDRIREQSIRDSLTFLYNHQFFQERIDKLLKEAIKEKRFLALIIFDLDHFKEFNDTYGHQAGDLILKKAAEILTSEAKSHDIIARYGGEEFVVILPGADDKASYQMAEKIRERFAKSNFEFEGRDLNITISGGVSVFNPAKAEQIKKNLLIKYADQALYRAKGEGRNRIISHKG